MSPILSAKNTKLLSACSSIPFKLMSFLTCYWSLKFFLNANFFFFLMRNNSAVGEFPDSCLK